MGDRLGTPGAVGFLYISSFLREREREREKERESRKKAYQKQTKFFYLNQKTHKCALDQKSFGHPLGYCPNWVARLYWKAKGD